MIRPLAGSTYGRLREAHMNIKLTHKSENTHGQRRFSTSYPEKVNHSINLAIHKKTNQYDLEGQPVRLLSK